MGRVRRRGGAEEAPTRLVSELKWTQAQMTALLEIAKDISGSVERDEIIDRVQRRTVALLPCDRVVTYYWDPHSNTFRDIAHYGLPQELEADARALDFRPGVPITDRLTAGHTVVIDDAEGQNLVPPPVLAHFGIRALAAVPLAVRNRVLGAFAAISTHAERRFTPEQIELLESIARQIAVAIETTDLYRAQQEEAQIAAGLARVGQEMISLLDTPVLLDRLCQLTTEVLECDSSHTLLYAPPEDAYLPVSGYGYPREQWEALRMLKLPRAMFGDSLAALDREEVRQSAAAELTDVALQALAHDMGITVSMGMALRRGREMIGFLVACYRGRQERFTAQQERMARGIAQIASLALANARLVEELERASRLKSDFVATMSHELRTPLNVIVGYNALLLDRAYGEVTPQQAEVLQRVERSAHELLELINATLDLSRLEAGRLPLDVRDVCVADLIGEIDAETRTLRDKPGVSFAWHLPPQLPRIRTDPMKLKVVLKNLIGNALKFTERGSVTVCAQPQDGWLEFTVADTGIGIAPENRAVIFEPFRQADGSTTRRYGGIGLGLYIVRRLVEILNGTVTLDSALGRGSTFCVSLPMEPPDGK